MLLTVLLGLSCASAAQAQKNLPVATETAPFPGSDAEPARRSGPKDASVQTLSLTVPKGSSLQVVLDKEVRIRKVGQMLQGRIVEPVYAFDKLVIPVNSQISGEITKIESISALKRTTSALDADFTPARKIEVEFTDLVLPNGKHVPIVTSVTPGSGQVIQFVSATDDKRKGLKDEAGDKAKEAKQQAKQEWDAALKQVQAPGKVHRIERYAIAQLPVHPQYIDAGTAYFAELQQPLDFGAERLTQDLASSIGTTPPDGAIVHARLMTPLSSATAHKGDEVAAVISQPLFEGTKLILPQSSFLKGSVVQAKSARRLSRNGQLRFAFHDLVLPDGVEEKETPCSAESKRAKPII